MLVIKAFWRTAPLFFIVLAVLEFGVLLFAVDSTEMTLSLNDFPQKSTAQTFNIESCPVLLLIELGRPDDFSIYGTEYTLVYDEGYVLTVKPDSAPTEKFVFSVASAQLINTSRVNLNSVTKRQLWEQVQQLLREACH